MPSSQTRPIYFFHRLSFRLILSFLFVSIAGIGLAAILARLALTTSFNSFINEQELSVVMGQVTDYYEQNNQSFAGLNDFFIEFYNSPQARGIPPLPLIVDTSGETIASRNTQDLNRPHPPSRPGSTNYIPIEYNGETIAYILPPPNSQLNDQAAEYLGQMYSSLIGSAVAAAIVALILGVIFARQFTRPINSLTAATNRMAEGNLSQRVNITTKDEIGDLGKAFNQMSEELAKSNERRKQMTADIAHDLRNPLLVLNGYLEAMRDKVLAPTPERFEMMYQEVQHLSKLVDDLRTLSLADSGELPLKKQEIVPEELLKQSVEAYQQKALAKSVKLEIKPIPKPLPLLFADNTRLLQALNNLVSNALRYVAENTGHIQLSAASTPTHLNISVKDNGAGIPKEDLEKIFDRFYRVDNQRTQDTGQSGLGLAIARSIVEAHRGTISVQSVQGAGTKFDLTIPL